MSYFFMKRFFIISFMLLCTLCVYCLAAFPTITVQPSSVTAYLGDTVTFHCESSDSNVTYLWYYSETGPDGPWRASSTVSGRTDTYSFIMTMNNAGRWYRCRLRFGTDDSTAIYTDVVRLFQASDDDPSESLNGYWYQILSQSNFAYLHAYDGDTGSYNVYSNGVYKEQTSNGFSAYYRVDLFNFDHTSLSGIYDFYYTIPLFAGKTLNGDTFYFEICFCSPDLSSLLALQSSGSVTAGGVMGMSSSPLNVQYEPWRDSIVIGTDDYGRPLYFLTRAFKVFNNGSSPIDFQYLNIGFNCTDSLLEDRYIRFGFTSNCYFQSTDQARISEISQNLLNIEDKLDNIVSFLDSFNFSVSTINESVLAIYDLLQNSSTAQTVQTITSQLSEMLVPSAAWVEIIEDLADKYDEQEATLEDLGDILDSLEKPPIEDVLPSSEVILNSDYVDMSLVADVFDPIFNRQEIIWLLLAVLGLATISFILFGKKK